MHRIGDIAFAIVAVAGILVLTKPGSQGPAAINAIGGSFATAISAATGQKTPLRTR